MNNTLSVITICYNIKNKIERTCESIVNQTWQDFEWIVVDGGSTDGTLEVLQKYKQRIDILVSEPDTGIYNAMNKGIKLASGEWLNFMNGGDNFASDDVLEQVFKGKNYTADVLYGNMYFIKPEKPVRVCKFPLILTKAFLYHNCINHQSSFIKRDLFEKYGLYDENYRIVADWEKWLLFLQEQCKFEYLDVIVADFYSGGISSKIGDESIRERLKVYQKYFVRSYKKYYLCGIIPLLSVETVE